MPTIIEGNIEALSKNGNNIFPITTPRAIIEEGSDRNLLDMLEEANRIPTAAEIGARPDTWMPTAEDVGARSNTWMPTAEDVGARPSDWMPTAEQIGARPADWMPTAADVGAVSEEIISDAWSETTVYEVGNYCIYNDQLWRCLVANTNTPPTGGGDEWEALNIASEIANVNSKISGLPYFLNIGIYGSTVLRFKGDNVASGSRQTVFIFGSMNGTDMYGVIKIQNGSATFTGNRNLTASVDTRTKVVSLTLSTTVYDTYLLISVRPLEAVS